MRAYEELLMAASAAQRILSSDISATRPTFMTTLRKILIPVLNTDANSNPAMRKAAQLALATGATLELFHALRPPLHGVVATYSDSTAQQIERERGMVTRQLSAAATRLHSLGIEVRVHVAVDYPAFEAIIRRALLTNANLIVLDGHVRHRFASILQLTDWELLRNCPVPVLVVRSAERYSHPAILAAVDPTHSREKTAGLDQQILASAARFAGYLNGELHVVHAIAPALPPDPYGMLGGTLAADVEARTKSVATRKLQQALTRSRIVPRQVHIVDGQPSNAITEVANRARAQIVVMGVMSRSALSRLLIGSTAETALDAIDCDVLLIKPRGFQTKVSRRASMGVHALLDNPSLP